MKLRNYDIYVAARFLDTYCISFGLNMKRTCQCAHITSCIYTEDAWVLLFIFRSLPIVGRYRRLTLTVAFGLLSGGSDFSSKAPSDMGDEEKPVSLPIEQYFGSFETHIFHFKHDSKNHLRERSLPWVLD